MYAEVNGINLYYEIHGEGRPLVLLHGGLGSSEMFAPVLPAFAEHHQVILVDLQGHGRTADIDRPLDIRLIADDIAALIEHLGLDRPDVAGYSFGGGVALQTAVRHPERVGKLVAASAGIRRNATHPEILEQQGQMGPEAAEFMKETPMYESYQRLAPRPEDFPRLLEKISAFMAEDYDFTEDVRGLRVPTLVLGADAAPGAYESVLNCVFGLEGGAQHPVAVAGQLAPVPLQLLDRRVGDHGVHASSKVRQKDR